MKIQSFDKKRQLTKYKLSIDLNTYYFFIIKYLLNNTFFINYKTFSIFKLLNLNLFGKTQLKPSINFKKPKLTQTLFFKNILNKPNKYSNVNINSIQYLNKANNINLFTLYLQYSSVVINKTHTPHALFKLFFIQLLTKDITFINISSYYKRWINTTNLLLNIFYNNQSMLIFGNKIFKDEILSINWSYNLLDYKLFKQSAPFFFWNDVNYGLSSEAIFKKFKNKEINFLFILDLKIHEKSTYFFNKSNIFSIGLVSVNNNPWLVSYPIPVFSNNLFIQYYFLSLYTHLRQESFKLFFNKSQLKSLV